MSRIITFWTTLPYNDGLSDILCPPCGKYGHCWCRPPRSLPSSWLPRTFMRKQISSVIYPPAQKETFMVSLTCSCCPSLKRSSCLCSSVFFRCCCSQTLHPQFHLVSHQFVSFISAYRENYNIPTKSWYARGAAFGHLDAVCNHGCKLQDWTHS